MISKNYSANYSKCKNMVINHYEIFEKLWKSLATKLIMELKLMRKK